MISVFVSFPRTRESSIFPSPIWGGLGRGEDGYLALITVIVISVILLAITFSLSFSGYLVRFNILSAESKERSRGLAEACLDLALLARANDPSYAGNVLLAVGAETCLVRPILEDTPSAGQITIETQGIISTSNPNQSVYTDMRAIVDDLDLTIVSWEEVPNF